MVIREEVFYRVITEGRLEDIKIKYPNRDAAINNLSQNDPSGNNKYLAWMVKTVFDQGANPAHVISAIKYFHDNNVRFEQKDLSQYKTLKDLIDAIEKAKAKLSRKEVKESGVEKVYDDENITIVHPKTHAASCKYGSETKWCVTMKNDPSYFRMYSGNGPLFFFMDKRRLPSEPGAPRKNYWKVAAHFNVQRCNPIQAISNSMYRITGERVNATTQGEFLNQMKRCISTHSIEFYDAKDNPIRKRTVEKYIPNTPVIMEVLTNYVLEELGRFYDLYKKYDDEVKIYQEERSKWAKTRNVKANIKDTAEEIPQMTKELIDMIRMIQPDTDISELESIIKTKWRDIANEKLRNFEEIPEPKAPTTVRPNLSWYDTELDAKTWNERNKR